jgi:hypothetical protein
MPFVANKEMSMKKGVALALAITSSLTSLAALALVVRRRRNLRRLGATLVEELAAPADRAGASPGSGSGSSSARESTTIQ